jgi:hypothetical protein
MITLATFCLGSFFVITDAFTLSIPGICVGLMYAVTQAILSLFTEEVMVESGADAI